MSEKDYPSCPNCGIILKVSLDDKECPNCGVKLDSLPPPKHKKEELKSLSNALYNREKGSKKYEVRELVNVAFISIFLVSIVRFLFYSAVQAIYSEDGEPLEIPFNPVIVFVSNAIVAVIGVYPIIHMKLRGDGYSVFGLGKVKRNELMLMVVGGIVAGFGLFGVDLLSQLVNDQLYQVTGWEFWKGSSPEFSAYLSDSAWNRLLMSVCFILSAAVPEILFRGVIQKKLMEIYNTGGKSIKGEISSFLLSFLISSGIYFIIFLNPAVIIFALFSNFLLTVVYRFTKSVYTCMVVQAMYIIIALFILF